MWCMHRRPHRRLDGADPSPSNDACLCPCTQPHTSPPPIQWAGRSSLSTYRSAGPGLRHTPTIGTPAVVAVAWHVAAAAAVVVLRPSSHVRRRRRHGSVCVERGAWVSELETLCERVENIIDRSLQVNRFFVFFFGLRRVEGFASQSCDRAKRSVSFCLCSQPQSKGKQKHMPWPALFPF